MGANPFHITMKARYYCKGPTRYLVCLSWKGRKYWRSYYDHRFKLINQELARRLCESINQDIDTKGKGFDPKQWFECKGFQFRSYADQWLIDHQGGYAPSVRRDVGRMVGAAQTYLGEMDIRSVRHGNRVGAPVVNLYQGTRHSLGVQKLSEGHSLDILRDIFGHTTTKTTRRYAEADMTSKRRVIE